MSARRAVLPCTIAVVFAAGSPVLTLDPAKALSQYRQTRWTRSDGYPAQGVNDIAESREGYLILATNRGLVRFDGRKFTAWDVPGSPALSTTAIADVLSASDGTVWVRGLRDRLIGQIDGRGFVDHGKDENAPTGRGPLVEGPDGAMWSSSGPTLLRHEHPRWVAVQGPVKFDDVAPVAMTAARQMWFYAHRKDEPGIGGFVDDTGAFHFARMRPIAQSERHPFVAPSTRERPQCAVSDLSGTTWLVTQAGIRSAETQHGPIREVDLFDYKTLPFGCRLDRDGNIWVNGYGGVHRLKNPVTYPSLVVEKLAAPGLGAAPMLEDREGNIWIAAPSQLLRLSDTNVSMILNSELGFTARAVTESPAGVVWVGGWDAIARVNPDLTIGTAIALGASLNAMSATADDRLWLAVDRGLLQFLNGKVTNPGLLSGRVGGVRPQSIDWIHRDAKGELWLFGSLGTYRFDGNAVTDTKMSRPREVLFAAGRNGRVCFARREVKKPAELICQDSMGSIARVSLEPTTPSGTLFIEDDRTIWLGGDDGLARLDDGAVTRFEKPAGLAALDVSGIVDDADGHLWLETGAGLLRVKKASLPAHPGAVNPFPAYRVYDDKDGLRGRPLVSSTPLRSADGRVWFITDEGLAVLSPRRLTTNDVRPPVHIERVVMDRQSIPFGDSVVLPAGARELQIDYVGISLTDAGKVRYRYRLDGYHDDWQDVGDRAQAFFNNLPPRTYTFRVIAANADGVWNDAGASLGITVQPAFYQTTAFVAVVALAGGLAAFALYRVRLRRQASQLRTLYETRLGERARVARDLHDTLIQDLVAVGLQVDLADDQLADEPDAARETVRTMRQRIQRVIADGRAALATLRFSDTPEAPLAEALGGAAALLRARFGSPAVVDVALEGHERPLKAPVRDEMYWIGREAVANALQHSGGTRVTIRVAYMSASLELVVTDNGCGMTDEATSVASTGHFGLRGMRDRAEQIGARLVVRSRIDAGTEVSVAVSAVLAYESESRPDVN